VGWELYCLTFVFKGRELGSNVCSPPEHSYQKEPDMVLDLPLGVGGFEFGLYKQKDDNKKFYLTSLKILNLS
jgi:hypothetical protein